MRVLPYLCALLLGAGAAVMVGCGDRSNLIPSGDASGLTEELQAVQQAVADGECGQARSAVERARSAVKNLPDGVDPRLRSRILGGIGQLSGRSQTECEAAASTTTQETVPTTQETLPPETTSTPETDPTLPADPTTGETTPSTPVDPTQTDPSGGATPTDPGTDPAVPDPGGADPGTTVDPGTGFRAVPRPDARDQPDARGYFP